MYHADGQKIAKRLSVQISKETTKVSKALENYNSSSSQSASSAMVLDPSSAFWVAPDHTSSILFKQPVINNYLLRQRSTEELQILRQDMHNTLLYFEKKLKCIKDKLDVLKVGISTPFTRGAIALLYRLQNKTSNRLQHAINLFGKLIDVTCFEQPPSYVNEDLEKPEWSSDDDDDESDDNDVEQSVCM